MTHAAPPPGSRDEMVGALIRAYWNYPEPDTLIFSGPTTDWNRTAELIQSWLAYDRDLTRHAIELKLKAERERAIEEVAQCCDAIAEQARPHHDPIGTARLCAASARSLKVVP